MRLLVIGDLHYAQPREHAPAAWTAARDAFYTAFMRTIHVMQADVVVALGDATQHGFVTEWEQMTVAYNVTARYAIFWATTIRCTCQNVPSSPSRGSHAPHCRKHRAHGCSFWTRRRRRPHTDGGAYWTLPSAHYGRMQWHIVGISHCSFSGITPSMTRRRILPSRTYRSNQRRHWTIFFAPHCVVGCIFVGTIIGILFSSVPRGRSSKRPPS